MSMNNCIEHMRMCPHKNDHIKTEKITVIALNKTIEMLEDLNSKLSLLYIENQSLKSQNDKSFKLKKLKIKYDVLKRQYKEQCIDTQNKFIELTRMCILNNGN
jgi:hypothetical protein